MQHIRTAAILVSAIMLFGGILAVGAVTLSDDHHASVSAAIPAGAIPVSSPADIERVGTGQTYGGHTWTMDAYYYMTQDIVLTGTNNHTPVGTSDTPFTGTFDGQERTISGMNFDMKESNASGTYNIGLFGYVSAGTIKDLGVIGGSISVSAQASSVTVQYTFNVGGIIGNFAGQTTITGCYFTGAVNVALGLGNPTANAGGVAGNITSTSTAAIINCYNEGSIKVTGTEGARVYAGGIFGYGNVTGMSVFGSYNTGSVTTDLNSSRTVDNSASYIGGIGGSIGTQVRLTNCYNSGNVSSSAYGGGASSSASVASGLGGGIATNCYNTGDIHAEGLGSVSASGIGSNATRCYNTGAISAIKTVNGSSTNGVSASGISSAAADCYNTGNITAKSTNCTAIAGGISAGNTSANYTGSMIAQNCYNTSQVSGSSSSASAYVGGIVGYTYANRGYVTNCYFLTGQLYKNGSQVSSADESLYGGTSITADGTSTNPSRITPLQSSGAKTSAEMRPTLAIASSGNSIYYTGTSRVNSVNYAGWDFSNTWTITNACPVLRQNELDITSSPATQIISGETWTYTPSVNGTAYTLSVTGASWLSVSGDTISGTAPAPSNGISQSYAVKITASETGSISATQEFTITVYNPEIKITSTPMNSVEGGSVWTYVPVMNTTGCTLSVTGASWLSVSGGTISGTAPMPSNGVSQNFSVTLTANKAGFISAVQNFTIVVNAPPIFIVPPVASLVITSHGSSSFFFDASSSTDFSSVSFDLGDGTIINGVSGVYHTYSQSGRFFVTLVVSGPGGSDSVTKTVNIYDSDPSEFAYSTVEYRYASEYEGNEPSFTLLSSSGVPSSWLAWDTNKQCVIGTPSAALVGRTFSAILVFDDKIEEWNILVLASSDIVPVVSFTAGVDGLTGTFTSETNVEFGAARYSWSVFSPDNSLVFVSHSPDIEFTASGEGVYRVVLDIVTQKGPASYSQLVTFTSPKLLNNTESESEPGHGCCHCFILILIIILILLLCYALHRRHKCKKENKCKNKVKHNDKDKKGSVKK